VTLGEKEAGRENGNPVRKEMTYGYKEIRL
jgi:hypothetical protein